MLQTLSHLSLRLSPHSDFAHEKRLDNPEPSLETIAQPPHTTRFTSQKSQNPPRASCASMTYEHTSDPRSTRASTAQALVTLPSSRELGDAIPPTQPDDVPVATSEFKFGKSWAHFVAGG